MPVGLSDDFESYSLGTLNGQGSWISTTAVIVNTTKAQGGSKSVSITAKDLSSNAMRKSLSGEEPRGIQSVYYQIGSAGGCSGGPETYVLMLRTRNTGFLTFVTAAIRRYPSNKVYLETYPNAGNAEDPPTSFIQIGTDVIDTWHRVDIEWYANFTIRARFDKGDWHSIEADWITESVDTIHIHVPESTPSCEGVLVYVDTLETWDIIAEPGIISLMGGENEPVSATPGDLDLQGLGDIPRDWYLDINIKDEITDEVAGVQIPVKPWNHKVYTDTNRQRGRTYPPKDAQPWRYGTYPEMEYFVDEGYLPIGAGPVPPIPTGPLQPTPANCGARSLLAVANPSTIECESEETIELSTVGAIGRVEWTLLDPLNNAMGMEDPVIQLNECAGTNGGFITFAACDECCRQFGGFSTVSVFIEGCDPPGCVSSPTISCSSSPCDEITSSSTKQYSLDNAAGAVTWSVTGEDATIDDTGLLTTGASACGTLVITAPDCCDSDTQKVRVTDSGIWDLTSDTTYDGTGNHDCVSGAGPDDYQCDFIGGGIKTTYNGRYSCESSTWSAELPEVAPCAPADPNAASGCGNRPVPYEDCDREARIRRIRTYDWICP